MINGIVDANGEPVKPMKQPKPGEAPSEAEMSRAEDTFARTTNKKTVERLKKNVLERMVSERLQKKGAASQSVLSVLSVPSFGGSYGGNSHQPSVPVAGPSNHPAAIGTTSQTSQKSHISWSRTTSHPTTMESASVLSSPYLQQTKKAALVEALFILVSTSHTRTAQH